jgi:cytochrome c oxidase subunit I
VHFWPSLFFMNLLFAPMFLQGMRGFHRRWYNGGAAFEQTAKAPLPDWVPFIGGTKDYLYLNEVITWAAFGLALSQIPFIWNFFSSIWIGKKVRSDNPWKATTLEWCTPTPPPHGNFVTEPMVYRGPYEYSVPGKDSDFTPQWEPDPGQPEPILEPLPDLDHHDHGDHGAHDHKHSTPSHAH